MVERTRSIGFWMSSVEEMLAMDLSTLVGTLTVILPSIVVVWRDYSESLG